MRLFVGIEVPASVKEAAARAADELRRGIADRAPRTSLRWVESANLHITLWFLGEVRDPRAEELAKALRMPFDTPPFRIAIGGAGAFPGSGPPRALWFGIGAGASQLATLHGELAARLTPLGFQAEKRPYSAHLTVARVKDLHRPEAPALRQIVAASSRDIGEWDVSSVTLFRSRLSPKGSQYQVLLRVPLS